MRIMLDEVKAIRIVGRQDHIVAVEVLDNAVFLKGYYPAGVLMHPIIDDKDGLPSAEGRFYKYGWVELEDHAVLFKDVMGFYSPL